MARRAEWSGVSELGLSSSACSAFVLASSAATRLLSASGAPPAAGVAPAGADFSSATAAAAASARVRASRATEPMSSLRRATTAIRSSSDFNLPSSVAIRFASAGSLAGARGAAMVCSIRATRPASASTGPASAVSGAWRAASSWHFLLGVGEACRKRLARGIAAGQEARHEHDHEHDRRAADRSGDQRPGQVTRPVGGEAAPALP